MATPLEEALAGLTGPEVERVFEGRYGVRVKREGNLALFKYDQLAANWAEGVTHECRGAICREIALGVWRQVSRPFAKFFNLSEGHCPLFGQGFLLVRECWAVEKVDGTCIQVWWDAERREWRASTLGTITPQAPQGGCEPFDVLFWCYAGLDTASLDPRNTYIFELSLPVNQVVTAYLAPRVTFLASRENRGGEIFALASDAHTPPEETSWAIAGATSAGEVYAAVEAMQVGPEWGHVPEGIVLYHPELGPVAKVKRSAYLALHRFSSHDPAQSTSALIGAFFAGQLDDIEGDLTPHARVWCERLRAGFRAFLGEEHAKIRGVCEQAPFATRKDFALALQAIDSPLFSIYIQRQPWIEAGAPDFLGEIEAALKAHHKGKASWERLIDRWRAMILVDGGGGVTV